MENPLHEKQNLKSIYNKIADVWIHLKAKPLEEVVEFSSLIKKQELILDIGCSNCRNLIPFLERDFPCIGLDFSKNMVREAKKFLDKKGLYVNLVIGDTLSLPFKDKSIDYILCTRVLHHLPTKTLRAPSLTEIKRVANERGEILISVYRRYYPRFLFDYFSSLFEKKFEFGDAYKKWTYHGNVYKRFFHLFSLKEIEKELEDSGLKVESIFKNNGSVIAKCRI